MWVCAFLHLSCSCTHAEGLKDSLQWLVTNAPDSVQLSVDKLLGHIENQGKLLLRYEKVMLKATTAMEERKDKI